MRLAHAFLRSRTCLMALPAGGLALIIFGSTFVGASLAAALVYLAMSSLSQPKRHVIAHALFVFLLASPFFVWSILINLSNFDSGVVVFPIAMLGAVYQGLNVSRSPHAWVIAVCCVLPALAYIVGAVIFKPPLLITYSAVAAAVWVTLAVVGYRLVRAVANGEADILSPHQPPGNEPLVERS